MIQMSKLIQKWFLAMLCLKRSQPSRIWKLMRKTTAMTPIIKTPHGALRKLTKSINKNIFFHSFILSGGQNIITLKVPQLI